MAMITDSNVDYHHKMMIEVESSEPSESLDESSSQLTGTEHDTRPENSPRLAARETLFVNRSKMLVYIVLFLAAIGTGTATYFFLAKQEQNDFESYFISFSKEIADSAESNAVKTASVIRDLSVSITSNSLTQGDTWPYVTLPDFETRTEESLELSGADLIGFTPVVYPYGRDAWLAYARANQGWYEIALEQAGIANQTDPGPFPTDIKEPPGVTDQDRKDVALFPLSLPLWQMSPVPTNSSVLLLNLYMLDWFRWTAYSSLFVSHVLLTSFAQTQFLMGKDDGLGDADQAHSAIIQPVRDSFGPNATIRGFLFAVLPWESYFTDLLPEGANGFVVDIKDGCGTEYTYRIDGRQPTLLGLGDRHQSKYDHLAQVYQFAEFARISNYTQKYLRGEAQQDFLVMCSYSLSIYPSSDLEGDHKSPKPLLYSLVVVFVFFFTAMVFVVYDYAVQRRQQKVLSTAERTNAIVSSLFPENVQKRILEEAEEQARQEKEKRGFGFGAKNQLKEFLDGGHSGVEVVHESVFKTKPIADLFPDTTVMFADLVGFTAWSSTREPCQVFMLLETIYHAFDEIARRRRVFKVETVGDCYVAVAGLPEPRKDHAVVMARFARDCLHRLYSLLKELEEKLGPDTADLGMRFGLHSGPVTAGVLRGERARFQLFGDTVNTTARMESNGAFNKIHISQETADLLRSAGKGSWIHLRADKVFAKGKGELTTFWLDTKADNSSSARSGSSETSSGKDAEDHTVTKVSTPGSDFVQSISDKHARLINWNTDILKALLEQVNARRKACGVKPDPLAKMSELEQKMVQKPQMVLDEVKEVIFLPKFDQNMALLDSQTVQLDDIVVAQLHEYVQTIAVLYRDNPFHNFEHVSHVTMSVVKLLSRIVAPNLDESTNANERTLHDHTYGITSDPLTQFAVVFATLIHDVDHPGVSNMQLVKEKSGLAVAYKNKSVAEQNSVDIAWDLLMDEPFEELRRAIYTTESELVRFRGLVVNAVMATDIMDKDLGAARKERWNKAFAEGYKSAKQSDDETSINRKATIVIEHIIQASDVAHTMQHWHVYRKWNTRLFEEMYKAFRDGRGEKDPSESWYEGELGFFDYYIIPLAKKLKDCGVFGVSSDEYLTYAQQNREEWEIRGREVIAEMLQSVQPSKIETQDREVPPSIHARKA